MHRLKFTVPGPPRGKGRPRFAKVGGYVRTYTDAATASYENLVALAASEARNGAAPMAGPVTVHMRFAFQRPKSDRKRPIAGIVPYHAKRPDLDNLVKAVLDGINQAGVWTDDAQVAEVTALKVYGEPGCTVLVRVLDEGGNEDASEAR